MKLTICLQLAQKSEDLLSRVHGGRWGCLYRISQTCHTSEGRKCVWMCVC